MGPWSGGRTASQPRPAHPVARGSGSWAPPRPRASTRDGWRALELTRTHAHDTAADRALVKRSRCLRATVASCARESDSEHAYDGDILATSRSDRLATCMHACAHARTHAPTHACMMHDACDCDCASGSFRRRRCDSCPPSPDPPTDACLPTMRGGGQGCSSSAARAMRGAALRGVAPLLSPPLSGGATSAGGL